MTTPLFLLRCVQIGLSIRDLDLLTIGMVNDMYAESSNDDYKYPEVVTVHTYGATVTIIAHFKCMVSTIMVITP